MFARILRLALLLTGALLFSTSSAFPLDPRQRKSSKTATTGASRLPAVGSGAATATDGSTIVERTVVINGLKMRFKLSAPASELINATTAGAGATGTLGINVLLHGDGGQSFFDFPNQGVNNGLMGVALLSPDSQLRWGGSDPTDRTGLERPDGAAHSAAINQLITTELPKLVNFDATRVFMEGISGGSLLLSGCFLLPEFGASLGVSGAVLGCGGLAPQVAVQGDLSNLRLHWQSTVDEQSALKTSITQGIAAFGKIAVDAGLSTAQIGQLQTADASPNGGHCEFDERDFVSGVQLLTNNYAAIISGTGALNGVAVANSVVGNEQLFTGATTAGTGATTATRTRTGNRNRNRASALRTGRIN